jgi:hypothetical protein
MKEQYHDKVNELINIELTKAKQKQYASHFLSSLSYFCFLTRKLTKPSRGLDYAIRSDCTLMTGLGVYARYLHFPDAHLVHIDDTHPTICSVCVHRFEHKDPDYENMTAGQKHRMQYGFHSQIDALDNYHILKYHNTMPSKAPSELDLEWFRELLSFLESLPKQSTIKDVLKSIKSTTPFQVRIDTMKKLAKENTLASAGLTANTELFFERFLEILGFCGVLDSEGHRGYLFGEVLAFPPRVNWVSDWYYPADFWKGEYGINKEALSYWFGDFI